MNRQSVVYWFNNHRSCSWSDSCRLNVSYYKMFAFSFF